MRSFVSLLCLSLSLASYCLADSCQLNVASTARSGGGYASGSSGYSQIYDVSVQNSGSCDVDNAIIGLSIPSSASITQMWNLASLGSGSYNLTNYGSTLSAGSTAEAGFIVYFPNTLAAPATGVSASSTLVSCVDTCSSSSATSATTGSATTSAATTGTAATTAATTGVSSSSCQSSAQTTARSGGSFASGSGMSQIYDVVVLNTGNCPLNNIDLVLNIPAGAQLTSSWNLSPNSDGSYTVTSYQGTLPVGNSVNVGFVLNFPNTQSIPSGVSATSTDNVCNSCSASASTATTGSVTSATTATSTSTTSTTGSTSPACQSSDQTTARSGGSYTSGSDISQIYDVVVTNTGNCPLNNIIIDLDYPAGAQLTSSWNLSPNSDGSYTVTNYQGTLPVGNSVNVGFVLQFANTQTVPSGVSASSVYNLCNSCSSK